MVAMTREQNIMKFVYNVSAIVFIIALWFAACGVLPTLIIFAVEFMQADELCFSILISLSIPIGVFLTYKLTCLLRYGQKWFAKYIQKKEEDTTVCT